MCVGVNMTHDWILPTYTSMKITKLWNRLEFLCRFPTHICWQIPEIPLAHVLSLLAATVVHSHSFKLPWKNNLTYVFAPKCKISTKHLTPPLKRNIANTFLIKLLSNISSTDHLFHVLLNNPDVIGKLWITRDKATAGIYKW